MVHNPTNFIVSRIPEIQHCSSAYYKCYCVLVVYVLAPVYSIQDTLLTRAFVLLLLQSKLYVVQSEKVKFKAKQQRKGTKTQ